MNTVVKALSTALQKVEQSQFELMTVLLEEDRVSGEHFHLVSFMQVVKCSPSVVLIPVV